MTALEDVVDGAVASAGEDEFGALGDGGAGLRCGGPGPVVGSAVVTWPCSSEECGDCLDGLGAGAEVAAGDRVVEEEGAHGLGLRYRSNAGCRNWGCRLRPRVMYTCVKGRALESGDHGSLVLDQVCSGHRGWGVERERARGSAEDGVHAFGGGSDYGDHEGAGALGR